ncbi:sugar phosphate isomerase/epimerase family protein [Nocardiopsis halotolerans]|uniref:sugar phosphate isomerase/epimerase family protein n=1 Tax=Nocardiopsis halotolerans TaxID=124252 RepID=UPI00034DB48A|nr:TIM barrel protein [Nocardiopsis halotolerans]
MIGLSTYAYLWRWSEYAPDPFTLEHMLHDTAGLGADVFQICDYPPLEHMDDRELARVRAVADDLGLTLEVGTRGVTPDHLRRYLRISTALGSTLVRSMVRPGNGEPSLEETADVLARTVPEYADQGVELGLETYEQVPTRELVRLVEDVAHPALGIVLDPGNCVAALEHPTDVVDRVAPHVKNLHVKDFAFSRRDGWVGFTLAGAPLGEGLLDYDDVVRRVRPVERGISQVIEHWLPWTDDFATTARAERRWTEHDIDYLRRRNP